MSDNNITQDQLEPNVMEELESGIGDLSTLSTENKDSLVAAVTEIYGKNVIAEAIGEPLAVTDTFSEMGSEINSLLSSFKTNMMNSGVTVESGDKFKQLIEKIKGLTEGDGNKGIQFASLTTDVPITSSEYDSVSFTLDFVPSLIFITIDNMNIEYPENYRFNAKQNKGVVNNIHHTSMETCLEIENTIVYGTSTIYSPKTYYYITVNDQLFNFHYMNNAPDIFNKMSITYYAIGVGEEDTTLRDSLADILENKGVDVTEEDDMASLIGKVDNTLENNSYKTSVSGDTFIMHNVSWQGDTRATSKIDTYLFTKGSVKVTMNAYTNLQAGSKYSVILYNNDGTVKQTYADGTYYSYSTINNYSWDIVDVVPGDRLYAIVNGTTAKIKVSCDLL